MTSQSGETRKPTLREQGCICPVGSGEGAWNEAHDLDCPMSEFDGGQD